ncbi:MAG: hypothetical protein BWY85_02265 [Firmicutes bacterium ADurb.Bin506]|nr:MAG: hypothetical protein BWY85_02265 [Firmicutes bacterium ADurb.Bin506]
MARTATGEARVAGEEYQSIGVIVCGKVGVGVHVSAYLAVGARNVVRTVEAHLKRRTEPHTYGLAQQACVDPLEVRHALTLHLAAESAFSMAFSAALVVTVAPLTVST